MSEVKPLTEEQIQSLYFKATGGPLLLPLRVENWHQSLTDGGWYVKHSTGRVLATVEFVEAERVSGKPAIDGNAPARAVVELLNSVPALIATVRQLQQERDDLRTDNERLSAVIFSNKHAQLMLTSAVALCRDKSVEWAKQSEEAQARGIQTVADGKASRALAANELAAKLEQLK